MSRTSLHGAPPTTRADAWVAHRKEEARVGINRRPDSTLQELLSCTADDFVSCVGGSMRRAMAAFAKADMEHQGVLCPEEFLAVLRRLGVSIKANQVSRTVSTVDYVA